MLCYALFKVEFLKPFPENIQSYIKVRIVIGDNWNLNTPSFADELVIFVVLVVLVVLVLVVSGIQHVDCVTFCTSFFERCNKRKRQRERERKGRGRERERKKERERERERKGCYCKRLFLLLLAPGSPPEKFAVIPNLGNKPRKVNWALSWSSALALEICGKTVL